MFHIALLLLSSLCLLAQTPSTKSQKLSEIDRRIATLQSELAGLTALRASISSGQLPDSAIAMINVASVTNPAPTALAAITPTPKPAPSSLDPHPPAAINVTSTARCASNLEPHS